MLPLDFIEHGHFALDFVVTTIYASENLIQPLLSCLMKANGIDKPPIFAEL